MLGTSPSAAVPRLALLGLCVAALAGGGPACTHTYVYGERSAPVIEGGDLVVPKQSGEERYSIRRIGVTGPDPYVFRPVTDDEIIELKAGAIPDGVKTLKIEVDNTWPLFRDWGLAGFGIGVTTAFLLFSITAASNPGVTLDSELTLPLIMAVSGALGLEFMLIGVGFGAGVESGETDMRYRRFADE